MTIKKHEEVITVTKIQGDSVSYSGSKFFSGSHVSKFPDKPEIGKTYILVSDLLKPSVIKPNK